jgi:hypothetical protein
MNGSASSGRRPAVDAADSGTESALSSKSQNTWRRMTVYTGAADQLPDPTYETAVGVGYAPAYRDRGTVFLEGLQLGSAEHKVRVTDGIHSVGPTDAAGMSKRWQVAAGGSGEASEHQQQQHGGAHLLRVLRSCGPLQHGTRAGGLQVAATPQAPTAALRGTQTDWRKNFFL